MSFNYRLSDINCSLGISQLSKLNKFINQRKKIFDQYREKLKGFKEFVKINNYNNKINGFHLIILNINFNRLKSTKDKMFRFLNKHNIFPQYHYIPLYKFSFPSTASFFTAISSSKNFNFSFVRINLILSNRSSSLLSLKVNPKLFSNR